MADFFHYLIYRIASLCLKLHGVVGHGELPLFVGNLDELLDLTEVRLRLFALSKRPIIYVVHKMMNPELMQLQFVEGASIDDIPLREEVVRICTGGRG